MFDNLFSCSAALCRIVEMSMASQSMYRAVKEAYEQDWVGYTELTSAVEVSPILLS